MKLKALVGSRQQSFGAAWDDYCDAVMIPWL